MRGNLNRNRKTEGFSGQKMIVLPKKIVHNIQHNPLTASLYLTDIGYFPKAASHFRKRPNGANEHILIYAVKGEGVVEIENYKHNISPDRFIIIPAGQSHKYSAKENNPWSIYWIHFTGNLADELVNLIYPKKNIRVIDASRVEDRISIFEEIYSTIELGYSNDNIYHTMFTLWHLLSSFLFGNEYFRIKIKKNVDQVESVINLMNETLDKEYTVQNFADYANLSVSHLSKLFKDKTGYAPVEFFIQLKIQKACWYLISTNMKIKEIAHYLNYDDPYYFSRIFSKTIGLSPSEYRKRNMC